MPDTSLPAASPPTPLPHTQKPQHSQTFTDPELRCPRLVRSEGTSPMVAGIIFSPFWYQNVSSFCPLLKIRRSMVWTGMATIQRIQRILSHCRAGLTPMRRLTTMSLLSRQCRISFWLVEMCPQWTSNAYTLNSWSW